MCSAERTLLRQRHHGMSLSGMPPMVEERRPRREEFSEPCTVIDRTFPRHRSLTGPRNSPRRHPSLTVSHSQVGYVTESCVSMTGKRRTSLRSTFLPRSFRFTRSVRATALSAGAVAACASLAVGCGVVPGTTGGSGDDSIVVMTWAPEGTSATNKPGMPAFARAYARWINASGGLKGRKLKVLTCNEHNDTVSAAKCAR